MNIEEIYSVKEIAELLHTNPTNIRNLIKDNKLQTINVSRSSNRKVWKITKTQLVDYLNSLNIKHTEEMNINE